MLPALARMSPRSVHVTVPVLFTVRAPKNLFDEPLIVSFAASEDVPDRGDSGTSPANDDPARTPDEQNTAGNRIHRLHRRHFLPQSPRCGAEHPDAETFDWGIAPIAPAACTRSLADALRHHPCHDDMAGSEFSINRGETECKEGETECEGKSELNQVARLGI
jgi:hypothetical protein